MGRRLPYGHHPVAVPTRLRAPSPALLLARAVLADPAPLRPDEAARIEREAAAIPYRDARQPELALPLPESTPTK